MCMKTTSIDNQVHTVYYYHRSQLQYSVTPYFLCCLKKIRASLLALTAGRNIIRYCSFFYSLSASFSLLDILHYLEFCHGPQSPANTLAAWCNGHTSPFHPTTTWGPQMVLRLGADDSGLVVKAWGKSQFESECCQHPF
jgi:hypothetical protein